MELLDCSPLLCSGKCISELFRKRERFVAGRGMYHIVCYIEHFPLSIHFSFRVNSRERDKTLCCISQNVPGSQVSWDYEAALCNVKYCCRSLNVPRSLVKLRRRGDEGMGLLSSLSYFCCTSQNIPCSLVTLKRQVYSLSLSLSPQSIFCWISQDLASALEHWALASVTCPFEWIRREWWAFVARRKMYHCLC